jgi:hypothetical protein
MVRRGGDEDYWGLWPLFAVAPAQDDGRALIGDEMSLPTTASEIWPHIEKWPFGVLSFVTPKGESRSAGSCTR